MSIAEADPPRHEKRWWSLVVLATGLAMIILDGTIVAVSLPRIIEDLKLDLTDAQWVTSLYSMIFAALLLSVGRMSDRFGRRRFFIFGVLVFVLGSVFAGLSDSPGQLISARALQGVGGAMILPTTLSTVNATFRGKDRAAAFGVWGAVIAGAAAIGPLLGGWLTTSYGWEWIFFVNVPIGAVVLVGALLVVAETRGAAGGPGVDVDGLLLSGFGMMLLVFGLIEGHQLGWWKPITDFRIGGVQWPADAPLSPVPVALAVGAALMALFVFWERHRARNGRDAILDLTLFRVESFSWGNITAATVAVGEFAVVFLLPLYLVYTLDLDILRSGIVIAAMALGAFFAGAGARHLAARITSPGVVVVGLALEIVGVLATAVLVLNRASPWLLAATLILYGLGLGLASAQLTGVVLADVPPEQSGSASATQSTFRQVGSALGSAIAGTALAGFLAVTVPRALAGLTEVPSQVDAQLARVVKDSAGGAIAQIREQGDGGQFGEAGPQIARALETGFAGATSAALFVAAGFLVLGLLGSFKVRAVARREQVLGHAVE